MELYYRSTDHLTYDGIALDTSGNPQANTNISLRLSILANSPTGSVKYTEDHSLLTDSNAKYNCDIGNGNVISGSLDTIDWGLDSTFLKVEIDINNGSSYTWVCTTQLVSVPYSLFVNKNRFRGALLKRTSAYTTQSNIPYYAELDHVEYESPGIWDLQQPTRLTVPNYAKYVRLNGNAWFLGQTGADRIVGLWKNGSVSDVRVITNQLGSGNYNRLLINSPVLKVDPGDYFELYIYQNSGTTIDVIDVWFSLEVVN